MKKKYHYNGRDTDTGADIFSECGGDEALLLGPAEHGKPLQPGQKFVQLKRTDSHFEIESVIDSDGHEGPAQVATEKYRSGWEATFGERPN